MLIYSVRLKLSYCLLVQGVFQEGELVKPGRCEKIHFFKLDNFKKHSVFLEERDVLLTKIIHTRAVKVRGYSIFL